MNGDDNYTIECVFTYGLILIVLYISVPLNSGCFLFYSIFISYKQSPDNTEENLTHACNNFFFFCSWFYLCLQLFTIYHTQIHRQVFFFCYLNGHFWGPYLVIANTHAYVLAGFLKQFLYQLLSKYSDVRKSTMWLLCKHTHKHIIKLRRKMK